MKKRLISLVAAAALVGGISIAQAPVAKAGTVTVAGDTQVQLYGRLKLQTGFTKNTAGYANTALKAPNNTFAAYHTLNDTNFNGFSINGAGTALGLKLANKDANLTGLFELGLPSGGAVNLRHAYIQHNFDNGLFVLIGQTNPVYEQHTFSITPNATAGWNRGPTRVPEIILGGKLDISDTASLDFKVSALQPSWVSTGAGVLGVHNKAPFFGADLGVSFETGFGAPARIYGSALIGSQDYEYLRTGRFNTKSKTSSAYTAGIVLPVSMITLQSQYQHAKGMVGLAGTSGAVQPGVYLNAAGNGFDQTKFNAFNFEAKVSPMPCLSVAAGYDHLKYKGYPSAAVVIKSNDAYFLNTSIKTTKYTALNVEWQHYKTKYANAPYAPTSNKTKFNGDLFYASYTYNF